MISPAQNVESWRGGEQIKFRANCQWKSNKKPVDAIAMNTERTGGELWLGSGAGTGTLNLLIWATDTRSHHILLLTVSIHKLQPQSAITNTRPSPNTRTRRTGPNWVTTTKSNLGSGPISCLQSPVPIARSVFLYFAAPGRRNPKHASKPVTMPQLKPRRRIWGAGCG